ncbi:hypothetical protein HELRODRAFT_64063, partial [Helobdella robusta]|uniref:Reverse transcriptase domain-containing protein n=1 Tax=Helobdella robusta TaxID=6412 RepID=T1FXN8_HELRO
NYRPISLVSKYSKVMEKILHSKISKFFDECGLFLHVSMDFKKITYSTKLVVLDVMQYALKMFYLKLSTMFHRYF